MRTDEYGEECPSTLGEYRDICEAAGVMGNAAVALLDERIAVDGRDEEVILPDAQMRAILFPLMINRAEARAHAPTP